MFLLKLIQLIFSLAVLPLTNSKVVSGNMGQSGFQPQHYPEQTHIHVATNELIIEIDPVNHVPPVLDLERISSYSRAVNIMSRI